jgi:hypothetical protein
MDYLATYDDMDGIIPPDVSGFGLPATITKYLPTRDELTQAGMAGGGVALGLIGGLGLERFLQKNVTMIPNYVYPVIHAGVGLVVGKLIADWNAPLGVGVASGVLALALLRAAQTWLKLDLSFSGLDGLSADLSDLGDLLGDAGDDTDLLPDDMNGLGAVMVEEQVPLTGFAGWPMA